MRYLQLKHSFNSIILLNPLLILKTAKIKTFTGKINLSLSHILSSFILFSNILNTKKTA